MLRRSNVDLKRLGLCVAGVFAFFVLHDALQVRSPARKTPPSLPRQANLGSSSQERAFRTPGYEFGWFMTMVEMAVVSACAAAFEWQGHSDEDAGKAKDAAATKYLLGLAVLLTISQGTGSAALAFVNFPIKVAFKSSKLCPAMLFGVLVTGKRYNMAEVAAALLMCASLALISLADVQAPEEKPRKVGLGCALLACAVFSDALVPNIQEKVLKELHYPVGRMIVLSNTLCLLLVFAYTAATGELNAALAWCRANQGPASLLLLQACCSYAGLRCYLAVVRDLSGVAGVVLTSMRKVVTLVISFLAFEKPFYAAHARGFALLALGVGLASYANARKQAQKADVKQREGEGPPAEDDTSRAPLNAKKDEV